MSKVKKVIIGILVVALAAGAVSGGLLYIRRMNETEVMVVDVGSVTGTYYSDETTLDGQITTNVSQNVSVDSDMIVQEVYVEEGSQVSVGDPLVSFDTTLVEMELNIARLKKQQQEQNLTAAVNRLNSLRNGGPIEETDGSYYNADNLDSSDSDVTITDPDEELSPVASAGNGENGGYLAAVMQPLLLTGLYEGNIFDDGSGQDDSAEEEGGETGGESGDSLDDIFDSGVEDDAPTPSPQPSPTLTPTPALDDDTDYFDPYFTDGNDDIHDGDPEFYSKLDENSLPFKGSGTEEDPYIFLCGSAKGLVTVTGGFLNKMAGYTADGSKIEKEGGYWYQLEFHQNDTITNFADRTESCIGYYLIDGSTLEKPVDMLIETEFTIEEASQYEENLEPEYPDDNIDGGSDGTVTTMTREEAIKIQQNRINNLKLDIQESEINIGKLEKSVEKKMIYSKLEGTVSHVGNAVTASSDGEAFITVQSRDGFYVRGSISELMLEKIEEGMTINCMSYSEMGMGGFEAEIVDISDYPMESTGFYYGMGNPNVSYYSFSAVVSDKSLQFSDMEYVTVTLPSEDLPEGSFIIQREFVLTENGNNYVYKEEDGVLKRQLLSVGGSVNGGYYVLVKGGLSMDDKVAFPYGSDIKEGAKTREVTLEEMYGY